MRRRQTERKRKPRRLPTDGTATAGEILELLSGSSNAINYEFHSTKTEGEFELDDFKKVMEEKKRIGKRRLAYAEIR